MSKQFELMDGTKGKLNKIINAAFKVFSQNDFEKASTSLIVKEANISRGLLYHYFEDKNNLYDYLQYYSYKLIAEAMMERVEWDNSDFFVRIYHSMKTKLELVVKYPFIFDFFDKYSHSIMPERFKDYRGNIFFTQKGKMHLRNYDVSLFKEDIDVDMATRVSRVTIVGVIDHALKKTDLWSEQLDLGSIFSEVEEYIEFLRKQFYK